ncbi:Hypothetical protein GSB_152054 [Giardia duodenalis]|uniref:Nucleoporin Nup54 alpha-helical domain-containing protein n=2 Tax=Giardia intestinalis TaxID=5741 RepID=C6LPP9_GIAIB|nr:Hypothetical protein GL50581_717 [Giardia intestinalis ATCC 50581]ESU42262.1 Hypothetical protein GSB_152054 [Giardia intestinalis]
MRFNSQPMSIAAFSGVSKTFAPLASSSAGVPLTINRGIFGLNAPASDNAGREVQGPYSHQQQIDIPQSLQLMAQKGKLVGVFESLLNIYALSHQTPLSGFFYDEQASKKDPPPVPPTTGYGGFGSGFGSLSKSGFGASSSQPSSTDTNVPPYNDEKLWLEAKRCCPDCTRYTPVLVYGFEQLAARATTHTTALQEIKKEVESIYQETDKVLDNSKKLKELSSKSASLLFSIGSRLEEQTEVPITHELACRKINQSLESQYGDTLRSRFLLIKEVLDSDQNAVEREFMTRYPAFKDSSVIRQIREHLAVQAKILMTIGAKIQQAMRSKH